MKVIRVYPSGFCKGVIRAINLVKETKRENPNETVRILGMIVHNSFVCEELSELGIIMLDETIKSKEQWIDEINGGILVFTAHGISDRLKQKAINKGLKVVDATCQDVIKTKNIITKYLAEGFDVIYFGIKNHPESNSIIDISNNIHLVTSIDDLNQLSIENKKIVFTTQTTMSYIEATSLIQLAKSKYPNIIIEPEICNATSTRQKAIMDLKDVDFLYVVGDIKSNNTKKLAKIATDVGIKNVKLISCYKDINKNDLIGHDVIHITAGASTPSNTIDEVVEYLSTNFRD